MGVRQLGEGDLDHGSNPPGSRPVGMRVMGRQGPAPKMGKWLREGPLEGLCPLDNTPTKGRVQSSKGTWATDTFMTEKQLEWRQERHMIIWIESVGKESCM